MGTNEAKRPSNGHAAIALTQMHYILQSSSDPTPLPDETKSSRCIPPCSNAATICTLLCYLGHSVHSMYAGPTML